MVGERQQDAPRTRKDLDEAIVAGDWAAVGAIAALLEADETSSLREDDDDDSIAESLLDNQQAQELRHLVDQRDWEGVVLAAAAREADSNNLQTRKLAHKAPPNLRKQVESLVLEVVPEEKDNVDEMMLQFKGREEELVETLKTMQQKLLDHQARTAASRRAASRRGAHVRSEGRPPSNESRKNNGNDSLRARLARYAALENDASSVFQGSGSRHNDTAQDTSSLQNVEETRRNSVASGDSGWDSGETSAASDSDDSAPTTPTPIDEKVGSAKREAHSGSLPGTGRASSPSRISNAATVQVNEALELTRKEWKAIGVAVRDLKKNVHFKNSSTMTLLISHHELLKSAVMKEAHRAQRDTEIVAIVASKYHAQFYNHLRVRLRAMVLACEVLTSELISIGGKTALDYAQVFVRNGFKKTLKSADFGTVAGTVTKVALETSSLPGAAAIGLLVESIGGMKGQKDQKLAVARVAYFAAMAAVADKGIDVVLERTARLLVRARVASLTPKLKSSKAFFGRRAKLVKLFGVLEDTPDKAVAHKLAEDLVALLMKPPPRTGLEKLVAGQSVSDHRGSDLAVVLVSVALGVSEKEVMGLQPFEEHDSSQSADEPGIVVAMSTSVQGHNDMVGGADEVAASQRFTSGTTNPSQAKQSSRTSEQSNVETRCIHYTTPSMSPPGNRSTDESAAAKLERRLKQVELKTASIPANRPPGGRAVDMGGRQLGVYADAMSQPEARAELQRCRDGIQSNLERTELLEEEVVRARDERDELKAELQALKEIMQQNSKKKKKRMWLLGRRETS